jgi:hypothetical protein
MEWLTAASAAVFYFGESDDSALIFTFGCESFGVLGMNAWNQLRQCGV